METDFYRKSALKPSLPVHKSRHAWPRYVTMVTPLLRGPSGPRPLGVAHCLFVHVPVWMAHYAPPQYYITFAQGSSQ